MKKQNLLKIACVVFVLHLAAAMSLSAQSFTSLVDFNGANGQFPWATVVQGGDGNLYGTTSTGGANGVGSVFQMTPQGTLTTIYSFGSQPNYSDGIVPYGGLVLGPGGLYGTTNQGGANFAGTVFEITTAGVLTTLYNFCSQGNCPDGAYPQTGLTLVSGIFYGTTTNGGTNASGTVFAITPQGSLTTLYSFCSKPNCADGSYVNSPLLLAGNGKLYGTAVSGGAKGFGTIFKISTSGQFSTVHSFKYTDGEQPYGGLVQASDGTFYGTTAAGGKTDNGTVFKLTKVGQLTTLYHFCAKPYCTDGVGPMGSLIFGSNGNLYGTTQAGGSGFRGEIFEITTAGQLTVLHSFTGSDGAAPWSGLVASSGVLYGTTRTGGSLGCNSPYGCGTVFSLSGVR